MKNVIVIGAGIVGVSTALWLQRSGHGVTIVDRGIARDRASYGNAGLLASCAVVPVTVPGLLRKAPRMVLDPDQPLFVKWSYLPKITPWLTRYLSHGRASEARRIAGALAALVGDSLEDHQALSSGTRAERHVRPCDYLFVYHNRAHYDDDAFAWSVRRGLGYQWEELEGAAWHAYDPVYSSKPGFAVRLGRHGMISDPGAYLEDLTDHLKAGGCRFIPGVAEDIARADGKASGVRVDGETLPADAVVIATGAWSAKLMRKLGLHVPLESERGYHLELWEPNRIPRSPVMIASGKFVVTPMAGRLRLAGIVEYGGLEKPPSQAPIALLRKNIKAAIPGLEWKDEQQWMGHRPVPSDSIPLIGEVPGISGAFAGFGHHHVGLTGGPKTGRLLAQLISGQQPNIDLSPYSPARFAANNKQAAT